MYDDIIPLCLLLLVAHAALGQIIMADFSPMNAQVDKTLVTMANAVTQLKTHVDALAAPNNDAATIASICARLKAGTDQLDAAIVQAQVAIAAT